MHSRSLLLLGVVDDGLLLWQKSLHLLLGGIQMLFDLVQDGIQGLRVVQVDLRERGRGQKFKFSQLAWEEPHTHTHTHDSPWGW